MDSAAPRTPSVPATPLSWRLTLMVAVLLLAGLTWLLDDWLGPRGRALLGALSLIGLVAVFSDNLRAVNWRTVLAGLLLQIALVLFVLRLGISLPTTAQQQEQFRLAQSVSVLTLGATSPLPALAASAAKPPETYLWRPGYALFRSIGQGVQKFLEFTEAGSRFVFGALADPAALGQAIPGKGFIFAFSALPTVIFVSSFFTILYHLGVLQQIVRLFARVMIGIMGTSGAETLSAVANVFMGQTEAPLIVKPYVVSMTRSELLALMVGGMATISGGVMAVFIGMGADPVAILATSVMAAPCGLYLSKLLVPEQEQPLTRGEVRVAVDSPHRNVIDAAASGASDGLALALNIAAMLIAFLSLLALLDYLLQLISPSLGLQQLFGVLFSPVAFLIGVESGDLLRVGDLLGTKLVANEFVAYVKLTEDYAGQISQRSRMLSVFALTGFANFASIGIQLGGIGAMAPSRRGDLAQLGARALFAGFVATLVNAALAGALMD